MIKDGKILLTEEDLKDYHDGKVSDRLLETWDISLDQLKFYIENNNYEVIK